MGTFNQRKKDILDKDDKSNKGSWDTKIIDLCEKINSFDEYYTTSSCSGRIMIIKDEDKKGPGLFYFVSHERIDFNEFILEIKKIDGGNYKFKQEKLILHVACCDLESAEKLLKRVHSIGLKHSGIISLGKNIIVEIVSNANLEFPLIEEGELLVSEEFLKKVIKRANGNLEKGWERIGELKNTFP